MKTKHQDKIEALRADEEGKALQVKAITGCMTDWMDCKEPNWQFNAFAYRPKPTKKFVPWTPLSLPPFGTVIKRKDGSYIGAITGLSHIGDDDYRVILNTTHTFESLFEEWEQLNGLPCGTEESNV